MTVTTTAPTGVSAPWPGVPYPMGAVYDGVGTNFSVYSSVVDRVELCLFDDAGTETRLDLPEASAGCWHGYLPGIGPGQRYGFRAHGPYFPQAGLRCNPAKLLLDPYSKAVEGQVRWDQPVFPYVFGQGDLSRNDDDSAAIMPKSVVIDPSFDWGDDAPPRTPWHETILYEAHVKGFTMQHPDIAPAVRGTYAGLGSDEAIDYLSRLGVTAVELMPVHQFAHDSALLDRGLRNYWGYNSLCYLAPHNEYSASGQRGQQVNEFKETVKRLHAAGIEVLLDVVYNHTAEGNHLGPVLSFKGVDNPTFYRLVTDDPRYYMDYTGTGNSINAGSVHALQLMMDSLRYGSSRCTSTASASTWRPCSRARRRRGQQAVRVLQPDRAGPGHQPGEAHRRAVGRGQRRLPGRQLPLRLVGVERQSPRQRAGLLAQHRRHARRLRLPLHRELRPLSN